MAQTVHLEMIGSRIHAKIPYGYNIAAKSVKGYQWMPSKKVWTYPLDYRTCQELRQMAQRNKLELNIGPELWKWAAQERKRTEAIPDVQSMKMAELKNLPKVNPYIYERMTNRPFQTVGAAFLAGWRTGLIADEMGLGKTIQTIGAIQEADVRGPILIIAPKTAAQLTWPAQLQEWAPDEPFTLIAGQPPKERAKIIKGFVDRHTRPGFDRPKREWLIINPYWLRYSAETDAKGNYKESKEKRMQGIGVKRTMPELYSLEWSAIIIDESHEVLVIPSMNRKKWTQHRIGIENLPQPENGMRIAMSGTPARGKKHQFFGTLNWLRPTHYKSFWKWAEQHFEISEDGWSRDIGRLKDEKAFYGDLREVMIRRTKKEVAKDLPPIIYGGTHLDPHDHNSPAGIWLPLTPGQQKQYRQMVQDATVETRSGQLLMANGLLSEWTRMKQIATAEGDFNEEGKFTPKGDSNKLEWILEFLAERGIQAQPEGNGKVIIASQFAEVCEWVSRELHNVGIPSYLLTGRTKNADRIAMMDRFQSDEARTRVFILSTKAGGLSLTLDAADDVVIMDETFINDDQEQVEARAHRVSRPDHQVSVWYLRSLDTIEEAIAAVTTERGVEMATIMDSTRGQDIRKQIQDYKSVERKTA